VTARWLLLLSLAAAIPRLYLGAIQYIEYDGYWHVFIAIQDNWQNFYQEYEANFHPPLYYLLLKVATWFGKAPLVYRAISILTGVASVFLIGRIMQKLSRSRITPLLAAGAFAFSLPSILVSIEVRSYMLCVFLILVSFYAFLDVSSARSRVVFAVSAILATYSHYAAYFYVAACGLVTVAAYARSPRERLGRRVLADAATFTSIAAASGLFFFSHAHPHAFPPGHLLRFYFRPGTESVGEFLVRNAHHLFNLFSPVPVQSAPVLLGVLAVLSAGALILIRLPLAPSPEPRTGRVVLLTTAFLFAAVILSALAGKYPFGGELRQQFILYPFVLLCGFILFDRLLTAARCRVLAPVLAGTAAGLLLVSSGYAFARHPKVRTQIGEAHMARFRAEFPAPEWVYLDQYNLITFFLHHHDWDWKFERHSPTNNNMDLYRVSKGASSFMVLRDRSRWNADPLDRALYEDLSRFLAMGVTKSLTAFSVRQDEVIAANADDASVAQRILDSSAAAGLCVNGLWATPVNAFFGLRQGACPVEAHALPRCVHCDDLSRRVIYTGRWIRGVFDGASNGTLTYTDSPGAAARFSFEGPAVEYVFTKAFNRGIAEVVLDGAPPVDVDLYSAGIEMRSRRLFDGLAPGPHTIEIRASGRKRPESKGTFIDVDALSVPRT
jgi:hypothetical protein